MLLEFDITLVFNERRLPRGIHMVRQLCIELGMGGAVHRHPLQLAVCVTLIGIEKSDEPKVSKIVHVELHFEILTDIPGSSTAHLQLQSKMPKPTCQCLGPTWLAQARQTRSGCCRCI